MVRPIVKDKFMLSQKSAPADRSDLPTAQDLVETIAAHAEECVGMAANMIGVLKRIIVFQEFNRYVVMINPEVVWASPATYDTNEGCLCHEGAKDVTRHEEIEVEFLDLRMKKCRVKYSGITAEIIQHEMDHLEGILI